MRSCRLLRPGHRGPAAANVTARAAKPGRKTQGRVDPRAGAQGAAAPGRLRHNSHARRRPRERWNSARGGPSSPALPGSEGAHLSEPRAHLAPRLVSRPPHPHHAAVYHRARVSRAAASRTKSERLCFHHSRRAPFMEAIQQNKKPDKPDK